MKLLMRRVQRLEVNLFPPETEFDRRLRTRFAAARQRTRSGGRITSGNAVTPFFPPPRRRDRTPDRIGCRTASKGCVGRHYCTPLGRPASRGK